MSKAIKDAAIDPIDLFLEIDDDKDGYISYSDFNNGVKKTKLILEDDTIQTLARSIDQKRDGKIDITEFAMFFEGENITRERRRGLKHFTSPTTAERKMVSDIIQYFTSIV